MSLDPGFSTEESRRIFGPDNRLRSMLETEAALARATASAGLIPEAAAEAIAGACEDGDFDADEIFGEGWEAGSPVIPLVGALRTAVGEPHAEAVHFGATSQDILDTGLMLQTREGLERIELDLRQIGGRLVDLATEHRETPRLARTLLQPAHATVFGVTVARWLDALTRDIERVDSTRSASALQLGGAVGDQAAFGQQGDAVAAQMADSLGLSVPALPWHTTRDRVGVTAATLSMLCQTSTKIAHDLILLAQAEVGEVSMRPGSSSAMPGKQNPIDATRAVAAGRFAAGQAALLLGPAAHELERAAGSWQLEWATVPLLFHGTLAATEALGRAFETLEVDADRMASHLEQLPASRRSGPEPHAARWIDRAIDEWHRVTG